MLVESDVVKVAETEVIATHVKTGDGGCFHWLHDHLGLERGQVSVGEVETMKCGDRWRQQLSVDESKIIEWQINIVCVFSSAALAQDTVELLRGESGAGHEQGAHLDQEPFYRTYH